MGRRGLSNTRGLKRTRHSREVGLAQHRGSGGVLRPSYPPALVVGWAPRGKKVLCSGHLISEPAHRLPLGWATASSPTFLHPIRQMMMMSQVTSLVHWVLYFRSMADWTSKPMTTLITSQGSTRLPFGSSPCHLFAQIYATLHLRWVASS